jgi:hypothetical protein
MSLRNAHPERKTIAADTVVFDDLTDAFVAIPPVMPSLIAQEKNGIGWDAAVAAFVEMSKSLSRFEFTDQARYATDYIKQSDATAATLDLLKWRCSQAKKSAAIASLNGKPEARGHVSGLKECSRAIAHFMKLAEMLRERVRERRRQLNVEWNEAAPLRQERRERAADERAERRAIRKAENRALYHDRLKSGDRSIGPH